MFLADLDYIYPEKLIAQRPLPNREDSRMMVVERGSGQISHRRFQDILGYFSDGDVLVVNDSKVFPARIFGKKESGGKVECLLLREVGEHEWSCLLYAASKLKKGTHLIFSDELEGEILDDPGSRIRMIRLRYLKPLLDILETVGSVPLPPYIRRDVDREDQDRYQTVFAQLAGSVAAPTAGFHFTEDLLNFLQYRGVKILKTTLHVGAGTFLPIQCERLEDHPMHEEAYTISEDVVSQLELAKKNRDRITAVGTTVVRTLESFGQTGIRMGLTQLFIRPPFGFKFVDRLLTNFHQPRSTLLSLVYAFGGQALLQQAYQLAIQKEYRLFSYGDCMLIE